MAVSCITYRYGQGRSCEGEGDEVYVPISGGEGQGPRFGKIDV